MSIESLIADHVRRLRAERSLPVVDPTEDMSMDAEGLGLDSLDMATLVAVLERETGKDPFAERVPVFRTFREFVALYR